MPRPDTAARAARSLVFAAVTLALAVGAHWLGSGMVAAPGVLAIAAVVTLAVGWWAVLRTDVRTAIAISVAAQVALHVGFCLSMGSGRMGVLAMVMCGHPIAGGLPVTPLMLAGHTGPLTALLAAGIPMLSAHVAAAAVAGAWMHAGERVATGLATALAGLLAAVFLPYLRVTAAHPRRPTGRPVPTPLAALRGRAVGAFGLRGPPPALAC